MKNSLKSVTLVGIILLSSLSTILYTADMSITTTTLTPRVSMLQAEEEFFWNSVLHYSQKFGKSFSFRTQMEFGSETASLPNPYRIYDLTIQYQLKNHTVALGRLTHWSNLVLAHVDGFKYQLDTKKLGSVIAFGGFDAVIDFSDTAFTDNKFFLLGWAKGQPGKAINFSFWNENHGEESSSFFGGGFRYRLPLDIRSSASLAFALADKQIYRTNLRLSKSLGKHTVSTGIRQRRYLTAEPYPWTDDKYSSPPQLHLGVNSRLGTRFFWFNQLNQRLGKAVTYLRSSANYANYSLTLLLGKNGDQTITGLNLGARGKLASAISYGSSVGINSIGYSDIIEPVNSLGLYGYMTWNPADLISLRLFARYYQNPYYEYDLRGGMVLNVAL